MTELFFNTRIKNLPPLYKKMSTAEIRNLSKLRCASRLLLFLDERILLTTAKNTGTASGDKTDLGTGWGITSDGSGVTNVLMVTTTVRMLDGIHRRTTNLGPAVTLDLKLVEVVTGLEDGLVETTATSDDTDHGTVGGADGLTSTGRKADTGLLTILGVTDDDARSSGGLGDVGAVTGLAFQIADDSTFRHFADRQDVSDGELCFGTEVDKLTSVETLTRNHQLLLELETVRITEDHTGERSTTTRVMDELLYQTADVTVTLGIVEGAELRSALAVLGDRSEDGALTLSLTANNATHDVEKFLSNPLLAEFEARDNGTTQP